MSTTWLDKEYIMYTLSKTVGYAESDNKFEYMKGAEMVVDKILGIAQREIKDLIEAVQLERTSHEETRQDIITLAEILRKYTNEHST